MERVIGGIEKRVLGLYGGSLWWFLRHRWISPVIWVVCLAGTIWLFMLVPKSVSAAGRQWRDLRRVYRAGRFVAETDARVPGSRR